MSFSTIIAWLSRRFPEQLVVSKQDYKELREEVGQLNRVHQAVVELNNRLILVENAVKNINNINGFIQQGKGQFKLER